MELDGEEKIIRALFRELKLEDDRATPAFVREWRREPSRPARMHFGRVAFAVAVVSVILISTMLLRRHLLVLKPLPNEVTEQYEMNAERDQKQSSRRDVSSLVDDESRTANNFTSKRRWSDRSRRHGRLTSALRRRKKEPSFLSNWQSPTSAFLRLPGADLLKPLPQLNQSSRELGSFLNSRVN
jgi:hypothetical protein